MDYEIRQIGIGLNLPATMNCLTWERNALWSVYPSDHIGRPRGTAKAFYPETADNYFSKRILPEHTYNKEGNVYGSNDFRSTKHNLIHAAIQDEKGNALHIKSNGKQHLRTWVTEKGVSFLLANYSCAGNESYLRFDSDRTNYASELKMDGGDVAGWLLIYCGD